MRASPRWITLAAGVALALAATAGRDASAGTVSYAFNVEDGTAHLASPYGTVTLTDNTTTGTVTFEIKSTTGKFDSFGFNTSVATSKFDVTATNDQVWSKVSTTLNQNAQDGFGKYTVVVEPSSASNSLRSADETIVVQMKNSGDFALATAANFSLLATGGNPAGYFAAHLNQPTETGFVAVTKLDPIQTTNATPEPSTMILAAIGGVMGLGARWQRRRRLV
ncbi:MAG TPA: PEP-CTERM sorting domain-containing protein [Isosphaeraceae bacterium]|jgi:hypothetical protein|nr:PEP-CTERM sorting domain-containing protein [Isosphaeraceae bacterium]